MKSKYLSGTFKTLHLQAGHKLPLGYLYLLNYYFLSPSYMSASNLNLIFVPLTHPVILYL